MRVNRPIQRRSSWLSFACGCLAAFAILAVVAVVAGVLFLPQIIGLLTGMTPSGQTAAVFAQATPAPTVEVQNPTEPPQVTVNLGQYGQQTIANDSPQFYNFTVGSGAGGAPEAVATFTEAGLMQLCYQRSSICSPNSSDPRFRNTRIDLRPGGAVVYVDASIPQLGGLTATVGIVLIWNAPEHRVAVAGIDYGGTLYTTPPDGLGQTVADVEQQANVLINQLTVEAGGGRYALADVRADDTTLTLILH